MVSQWGLWHLLYMISVFIIYNIHNKGSQWLFYSMCFNDWPLCNEYNAPFQKRNAHTKKGEKKGCNYYWATRWLLCLLLLLLIKLRASAVWIVAVLSNEPTPWSMPYANIFTYLSLTNAGWFKWLTMLLKLNLLFMKTSNLRIHINILLFLTKFLIFILM